jgi:hypothetical protein
LGIEDEERSGRPTKVTIPKNVMTFIPQFWRIVEYLLNSGTGGLQHKKLKNKKVISVCVWSSGGNM